MGQTITKQQTEKIVRKLGAEVETGRKAHDIASVYYQGQLVAQFGIRRGSSKDSGHGHIASDLYLTMHQARELARCPLSYDAWIAILKSKGVIPEDTN
jgi:hypothetical protein